MFSVLQPLNTNAQTLTNPKPVKPDQWSLFFNLLGQMLEKDDDYTECNHVLEPDRKSISK